MATGQEVGGHGPQGPKGDPGATGPQGPPGSSGSLSVWFVDSVNGSDASDGLTVDTPLQTISALLGKAIPVGATIRAARGSKWRETISSLPDYVTVEAYGSGPRPLFDCSDVAANASWAKTVGLTNVYQIAWSVSYTPTSGGDRHCVWEDGVRLAFAASAAACDAAPGSYYAPQPIHATDTVYVHASDSSDVTANGKVYELCKRENGIVGAKGGSLIGLHSRRNSGNNGSILSYHYAKDCLAEDGSNHNLWAEGVAEDCTAWKIMPSRQYGDRSMIITFPSAASVGSLNGATLRRCRAIAGDLEQPIGFFAHTGAGTYAKLVYEECESINCTSEGFGGNSIATAIYKNCKVYGSGRAYTAGATNLHIIGGLIDGTKRYAVTSIAVLGCTNLYMRGVRMIMSANASSGYLRPTGVSVIENCTMVAVDPGVPYYFLPFYSALATSLTFRRNVLSGMAVGAFQVPAGCALLTDYNVYFGSDKFSVGATNYANLAAYQAGTGQDANSVTTDPGFIGQVLNGDCRVGNASPAWALMAGADYEGESEGLASMEEFLSLTVTP